MFSIIVGQLIGLINKMYQCSGDDFINVEVMLLVGEVVMVWVKIDVNMVVCDLFSGYGYIDGKFDVYWLGGYCYGVDGIISMNVLSFDGGVGIDFLLLVIMVLRSVVS